MRTLIGVNELRDRLDAGRRTVLLDVRWALGDPHGRDRYLSGHLPGAVYVDLETELAAPGSPSGGRHPLPPPPEFAAAVRRWGIDDGDTVVAYDVVGGMSAARAWWLLRHAGVDGACLLDGGLGAWIAAGLALESGDRRPKPGTAAAGWGRMPVIGIEEAAAWPRRGTLLDARAGERYRGETEPVDPRAGHVPGALSAPTAGNLDGEGRFLPAAALRARFRGLGIADGGRNAGDRDAPARGPVAVYCGSGVTAAHEVAALAVAGIDAALFPGSWSQWSADPDRQGATGPHP
ncbi:MAG: sulfurtransferase [Arthrobacter sp.]|uniref:sulfurtransferase n=1 Tax=Arthrobacter sp. TaxID=1667 RepID=UPI00348E81EC